MNRQEIEQQMKERLDGIESQLSANKTTWLNALKAEKDHSSPEISEALDNVIKKAAKRAEGNS